MIQRLIHRQLAQHHQLRNPDRSLAMGGLQRGRKVIKHFARRSQGFAGVGQEGFGVVGRVSQVHGVVFGVAAHDALLRGEVVV